MAMRLNLAAGRKLLVVVGAGGVGKTTGAAALAVHQARAGRRVLVLTADPARRLANALGVQDVRDKPVSVNLGQGTDGRGSLQAAMLETRSSFDDLVHRVAGDRAERIVQNRVYAAFSSTLARSHAYAAIERIHAAVHDDRYDLVVVDTPPAQSSMVILEAPNRLVRFLDQRVVKWFVGTQDTAIGSGGSAVARNLLSVLAGDSTVAALSEFLTDMAFLGDGFRERASFLRDYLCSDAAGFVLISSGDATGIERGVSLAETLAQRGYRIETVVFNQLFSAEPGTRDPVVAPAQAPHDRPRGSLADKLHGIRTQAFEENAARERQACMAVSKLPMFPRGFALPRVGGSLADVQALYTWIDAAVPLECGNVLNRPQP